jgi:hypothetical protein
MREGLKRNSDTRKKENRFFYIWKNLQGKAVKKYGWWKVCTWAVMCPSKAIGFARLLVAQRARIHQLEYDLHITRYSRDYYMKRGQTCPKD